jgi:hypothetical protein
MDILINNKISNFEKTDFPMIINGVDKSGASFFSVSLLASLLKQGRKTLLFSAYPMAKAEFRKQIQGFEDQAIIIDSGDEEVFIKTISACPDLSERVALIKNIDSYSVNLFNAIKNLKQVIISGNLDNCAWADGLLNMKYSSLILFSSSHNFPKISLSKIPQYSGIITSSRYNGIIQLSSEK